MTKKIATKDITTAIAGGRKAVEAFVAGLEKDEVVPFLALATPVKKDFDYGVKLAESRVSLESLIPVKEWTGKDGAEHRSGTWTDPASGVIYTWAGESGALFVADAAALRAELEMEDVDKRDLDAAVYQDWVVSFTNLKNIENTALRAIDSSRTTPEDKARAQRVIEIIRGHRDRKPDAPPHLKEKE